MRRDRGKRARAQLRDTAATVTEVDGYMYVGGFLSGWRRQTATTTVTATWRRNETGNASFIVVSPLGSVGSKTV